MGDHDSYIDLAQRIEEAFPEIENDIIMDLQEKDEKYASLCRKISEFKAANPIIRKVLEGSGDITLTADEHAAIAEWFRLQFQRENIERQQLYFRGHTDCVSYLKKVGAL